MQEWDDAQQLVTMERDLTRARKEEAWAKHYALVDQADTALGSLNQLKEQAHADEQQLARCREEVRSIRCLLCDCMSLEWLIRECSRMCVHRNLSSMRSMSQEKQLNEKREDLKIAADVYQQEKNRKKDEITEKLNAVKKAKKLHADADDKVWQLYFFQTKGIHLCVSLSNNVACMYLCMSVCVPGKPNAFVGSVKVLV
jgi:hypothetical protein